MAEQLADWAESRLRVPRSQALVNVRRSFVVLAGILFVIVATVIVAFDSVFAGVNSIATIEVSDVAPRDIVAPPNASPFVSDILTEERREDARDNVEPIYFPPDPNVARQQTQLAQQILDYITTVRNDSYAEREQLVRDVEAISALDINNEVIIRILQIDSETWDRIGDGIEDVLSSVMQQEITPANLQRTRVQLSNRVSPSYSMTQSEIIVAIVEDLVQPNTFINEEATQEARDEAAAAIEPQERRFVSGQIVVREGEQITPRVYESLQALNLLQTEDLRGQRIAQAFMASALALVIFGGYLARFEPELLLNRSRTVALLASIFLIMLAAVRFLGVEGNIYLFPASALALLYVAIGGSHIAIIGTLSLAFLTGIMAGDSLQVAALIGAGGIVGTLVLRRAERLNSFFVAGAVIALMQLAIVGVFNIATPVVAVGASDFATQAILVFFSGILLAPAAAIAAMYVVTLMFNLPTALKLIDLSQPSKPLLQRLLREAPGTYQHSLQVANLAEQAANAIGADAQMTHVAALYHDIGKMLNPLYFTENQQNIGNPHDTLNDPYRSADIIISHVTEGDELAKQYRLPNRLRDYIREHHGTTQVYVFYRRAVNAADGDESAVDIADFTYPGPRPQSRETAILMLADSCEAAVRSVEPESKQAISELVGNIIDGKRSQRQLDESGLTLNDLRQIQTIFVDILQGMFHPRINYKEAAEQKPKTTAQTPKVEDSADAPTKQPTPKSTPQVPAASDAADAAVSEATADTATDDDAAPDEPETAPEVHAPTADAPPPDDTLDESADDEALDIIEEEPMTDVPRLPTMDERKATGTYKGISDADLDDDADDDTSTP